MLQCSFFSATSATSALIKCFICLQNNHSRQNSQNSRKTRRNLTGYKGVSHAFGGVYTATIQVLGRSIWLGQYSDAISAHQVYCRAASKYFGSFANSGEV